MLDRVDSGDRAVLRDMAWIARPPEVHPQYVRRTDNEHCHSRYPALAPLASAGDVWKVGAPVKMENSHTHA